MFVRLDCKNYKLLIACLLDIFYADPLQVGVTVEALKDTKGAADQDPPLQRSIKRTNTSVLAMTEIAMWHPKNTNIPTRERKCLVQEVLVGLWAGLLTATSRPAGKSTTKRRTTTIPQKDIPQNAGETATLVQGGSATINTGDNKGKTRNGQLGIGNHRNIDSPSRFYFIMKCINLLFLGVCVLCVWKRW